MKPLIRSHSGRMIVAVATIMLPWLLKRRILTWLLGYQLDASARIGYSILTVASARMGKGARVGHLTMCRGLKLLEIGDFGSIGNLNWITGNGQNPLTKARKNTRAEVALRIGRHSAITNRHYIDSSDRIVIGDFTTIAGVRSQFLTHAIDIEICRQQTNPIKIGNYCFVGTGCIILPGAVLPDCSVLAAGSLLRDEMTQPWTLYAGVPAKAKKKIPEYYAYFRRLVGFVL